MDIVFVDSSGTRTRLKGRVGQSLVDLAMENRFQPLDCACIGGQPNQAYHKEGDWLEPKYGEGAYCTHCHVVIAPSAMHTTDPILEDEQERLDEYPFRDDITAGSRMGCQVRLNKDMDGLVVFVPDGPESDVP